MKSDIKHNHLLSLLQDGFTTINISFEVQGDYDDAQQRASNRNTKRKTYTYKAPITDNLNAGDLVVVESPQKGLVIVMVDSVDEEARIDLDAPFPYKWIVQKIDRTRYDAYAAQEENFRSALVEVERTKQREKVMKDFQESLPADSKAYKMFQDLAKASTALPQVGHGG